MKLMSCRILIVARVVSEVLAFSIGTVAMFLIGRHRDWIQWAGGLARLLFHPSGWYSRLIPHSVG